jgi:hypothetical protein
VRNDLAANNAASLLFTTNVDAFAPYTYDDDDDNDHA